MGHLFKHMAVRLWTALVIGSLTALIILPPVAGAVGPGWLVVPGFGLLVVAYWFTGMAFAAVGRRRLERLLGEATVWDRAGMHREVRQTLTQAAATVDSFLFSPLSRRVPGERLLVQMARFQLARNELDTSSDAIIRAYLHTFPEDRVAAVKWLDSVLAGRAVTPQTHDIAARIGTVHSEDAAIQGMLAQFYLAERASRGRRIMRPAIGPNMRRALIGLGRFASGGAAGVSQLMISIWRGLQSRQAKSTVKWAAMGLFMLAVVGLVVNTAMHLADTFQSVEKASVPVAVPISDPFTLQVAAYVKEADARRYVDQLKGHGLDAYWTRASGSSKTWYQVRISHFTTKAAARAVGEGLKKRKLIGDYYVANYKRPDIL